MAIAVILDFEGATIDQYDQVLHKLGFTPGGQGDPDNLFHWATQTASGFQVTDVWTTREKFEKFAREKIGPLGQEAGFPKPPSVTSCEVHTYLKGG